MSTRLHNFIVDELHALVFRLDIAESVEQLDEVTARLREEFIREFASLFSLAFTSLTTAIIA